MTLISKIKHRMPLVANTNNIHIVDNTEYQKRLEFLYFIAHAII